MPFGWIGVPSQGRPPLPGEGGGQGEGDSLHLIAKMIAFYSFALGGTTSSFYIQVRNVSLEKTLVRSLYPLSQQFNLPNVFFVSV